MEGRKGVMGLRFGEREEEGGKRALGRCGF